MDLGEFESHFYRLKEHFFPRAKIRDLNRRLNAIGLRLQLTERIFIDVYFNEDSGRLDFTTIKDHQRIFGYDNAGGWHYHPVEDPEQHESCPEPTLDEMFARTAWVVEKVARGEP
jgi:hypothetical protein